MSNSNEQKWREEFRDLVQSRIVEVKDCYSCKFHEHRDGYGGESLGYDCTVTGTPQSETVDAEGCEKWIQEDLYVDRAQESIYLAARKKAQEEIDKLCLEFPQRALRFEQLENEIDLLHKQIEELYKIINIQRDKIQKRDKLLEQAKPWIESIQYAVAKDTPKQQEWLKDYEELKK